MITVGSALRLRAVFVSVFGALLVAGCGGGGTGTERDSGVLKTTLSVEVADAEGQALHYQWRVTAGSVENRNAAQTVWTLPEGPGLHFAYVVVSDGQGGYAEQQYAVASDAFSTGLPARAPVSRAAPAASEVDGGLVRLRVRSDVASRYTPPAGGAAQLRHVYLPDLRVRVEDEADGELVFSGSTDLAGELSLPKLQATQRYRVRCAASDAAPWVDCITNLTVGNAGFLRELSPPLPAAQNLRLYGHIALGDGTVCGHQNDYFDIRSAATVALQRADGTALTTPVHVNRYGDYAIDAAVPARGPVQLKVQCEGTSTTLDVPAAANPVGYVASAPVELSQVLPNTRPRIVKMVANGPDGNVRGQMVLPEAGASSNSLPGANHFLTYKGRDTRLGACVYYRALGAVGGCDAQGGMVAPISFADWKRQHRFAPHGAPGQREVAATYINRMDLNLVRRMVATQVGPQQIAFYVCNSPGPEGHSQREVDAVLATAQRDEKRVACVAMEWSTTPGANGGRPFTKFFTFGPDGALLASVNLDGRGEKYLPGACVACHGGTQYNGRFPEKGQPSPYLGSGFLPFDTGNYAFGSDAALGEAAQGAAIHALNQLVVQTEGGQDSAVTRLVSGWYAAGGSTLNKAYVPPNWVKEEARTPGAARFYREVVGASCRTCHVSLGPDFDWDTNVLDADRASTRVCGGKAELALNASMPNALISRDRVLSRVAADTELATLMTDFLGCTAPLPDPVYPRR